MRLLKVLGDYVRDNVQELGTAAPTNPRERALWILGLASALNLLVWIALAAVTIPLLVIALVIWRAFA